MSRTGSQNRYVRFVETVAVGELGLIVFVGAVFLLLGSRTVHEIGVGFLVASFGVSVLGTASAVQSVRNSAPPAGRFAIPSRVRSVERTVTAAMNVSPETCRFYWATITISAIAFCLGALLIALS